MDHLGALRELEHEDSPRIICYVPHSHRLFCNCVIDCGFFIVGGYFQSGEYSQGKKEVKEEIYEAFRKLTGKSPKKSSFVILSIDLLKVNLITFVLSGMFMENVYLLMNFPKANAIDT